MTPRPATAWWVVPALAAALVAVRRRLVLATVEGESMAPTYRSGDRLLVVRRRGVRLRRGEVVVVERPVPGRGWDGLPALHRQTSGRTWHVKRVAAVPGDEVPASVWPALGPRPDERVPAGRLVLLGDNPASTDSRAHGYYPADRVLGRVAWRLSTAGGPAGGPVAAGSSR